MTREDYLSLLANEADRDIACDPEPIGRFNVAPGTQVSLLSERDEQLHLDPVHWGYVLGWWDKTPLINARVETAVTSKMFKPLREYGRTICFADGWFEWKKEGEKNNPTSYIAKIASQYSWPRSEAHPLSEGMRRKAFC